MAKKLSRIEHYLTRSRELILSEGVWKYCGKVMSRCKDLAYTTNEAFWFHRDLSEAIHDLQREGEFGFEICANDKIVTWLREHQKSFGWLYIPEEIRLKEAFRHCYPVATHGEKIIGYIKIGLTRVYIMDYDRILCLPQQTAMIYDTFVLPEYRRRGVCSYLIDESMRLLSTEGYKNLWCHIPPWNTASIRAYSQAGFKKVARIKFVRIFGCSFCSRSVNKMISNKYI